MDDFELRLNKDIQKLINNNPQFKKYAKQYKLKPNQLTKHQSWKDVIPVLCKGLLAIHNNNKHRSKKTQTTDDQLIDAGMAIPMLGLLMWYNIADEDTKEMLRN